MKNLQEIIVGCVLAKHKALAFNYFWNSLLNQTVKKFTIIFVYSDRQRYSDLRTEEIARAEDKELKLQTLWRILRQIPDWTYHWAVASDTWYPPNSLETILKIMQEKKANCVYQRIYGNYCRSIWHVGHETPWHLMDIPAEGSILYDRKTVETTFPRTKEQGQIASYMQLRTKDIEEAGLVKVWAGSDCAAWHLHHYNDPLPGDNRVAIPDFLKAKQNE